MTTAFLSSLCLALAALINLAPAVGALSGPQVSRLYAVQVDDPNLEILLRHRAVMFGAIGGVMLAGATQAEWFWLAVVVGVVSMAGYAVIAAQVGGSNAALRFVYRMDLIGLGCVGAAAILRAISAS